jgi:hypothetical protein
MAETDQEKSESRGHDGSKLLEQIEEVTKLKK